MTLWDLLTVVSFVMPISGAMASAKQAHTGFWGYATALLLGVISELLSAGRSGQVLQAWSTLWVTNPRPL